MRARLFLAFLPLLAPLLAGVATAQPGGAQPLDRLLPQIRRNVPGQFLDAEGATTGGNPHYHLKWLTPDGRVMWLDADARTGRVLGQSPGRDNFDSQRFRGDEAPAPPDRREEGRNAIPRDRDPPRFDDRRQYRQQPDAGGDARGGFQRPERNFGNRDDGGRPQGGFGGRFERGPGGDRGFGGRDFGNRPDRGNDRGFGGGRGRRGDGR